MVERGENSHPLLILLPSPVSVYVYSVPLLLTSGRSGINYEAEAGGRREGCEVLQGMFLPGEGTLLKDFCAQFLRLGVSEDHLLWPALHLVSGKDWEEAVLSKSQEPASLPPLPS